MTYKNLETLLNEKVESHDAGNPYVFEINDVKTGDNFVKYLDTFTERGGRAWWINVVVNVFPQRASLVTCLLNYPYKTLIEGLTIK